MKQLLLGISTVLAIGFLSLTISSCGSSSALVDDSGNRIVKSNVRGLDGQAEKYFKAGKYREALDLYKQLKSSKENLLYKGIAAYHVGETDLSLRSLIDSYGSGNRDERLYVYMADNYLSQGNYEEATNFYKNYLQYVDRDSPERNETIHKIKRCGFAKDYKYVDQKAFVENLGESVNTIYDELSALQSPANPNKYYFSSNRNGSTGGLRSADGTKDDIYGSYSADMYAIETSGGNWNSVSSIDPVLNTPRHDIIQDFSKGGEILYYLKTSDFKKGSILTDTFRSNREEVIFPSVMQCPMVGDLGDRDIRVFDDNTYLFSSMRKGGYGGYDLYILTKEDGVWSEPINLGPEINSSFDEITPYLTKNGSKLYFSSNRINSMGGFDVYETNFGLETGTWSQPTNLGLPINSPRDDVYFRLAADGLSGIMSSNRIESLGGHDLFMVYFKNQVQDQMNLSYTVPYLKVRERKILEAVEKEEAIAAAQEAISDSTVVFVEPVVEEVVKAKEKKDYSGVQKREVVLAPLLYGSSENITNPQNLSQLNKVIETLKIFPEATLEITGHAVKEGLPEFDLYFSIKRAEKAADYLNQNGISSDRIFLRGVGTQYSMVLPSSVVLSNKYNRRLDLKIVAPVEVPLRIIYDNPSIPDQSKDQSIRKFSSFQTGLNYKISLTATKQMYKDPIIRQESDIMIDKEIGNDNYQYTLGIYDTYSQARAAKSRLTNNSKFTNVTIEPYINGRVVQRNRIALYQPQYADIANFIRYELSN